MRVLGRMIAKEFLQLRRDRKMIPVLVVGPLVQLLALGYAANNDVRDVPLLLVDRDRTAASRELAERFTSSRSFRLVGAASTTREVDAWLREGRAQIALVVPEGYAADLDAARRPELQLIADGTDSASAIVGMGYAARIVGDAGIAFVARRGGSPGGSIEVLSRVWYNPDLRSRWFYVPAILAMVLMLLTLILPSMAVVREKEIGTLEQLIVTPVRPWQLILGKLFPYWVIGLVDLCIITAMVTLLFRVPLRGAFPVLVAFTLLFLLCTLGLGLWVSSLVRTQQQAMMASIFLVMVPMIYLSGLIFPIENMPRPIQWATAVVPLRYYNHVIRGVFLKGAGFSSLWPEALVLAGMGLAVITVAAMRFRKNLD